VIKIRIEKAIDIISNLLSDNCDEEQKEAIEYIEYFLNENQPIEDFTNTHILSTKALYNALPLLDSYYQWIPNDDWVQLKGIMFVDENMKFPKRYPFNQCKLSSLFNVIFYRSNDEMFGYKNIKNIRPKIMVNDSKYGVLDFTYHYFMDEKIVLHDLLNLSKIWNNLYIESEKTECSLHSHQLEIAEWVVGRRLATDFCELMKWLSDESDVMNDVQRKDSSNNGNAIGETDWIK
jgi:hypothetical protein